MKNVKFKVGFWLFFIGFIGVLSLLSTTIPFDQLPMPKEAKLELQEIPEMALRVLVLINPTIMLIIATVLGTVFYKKVNLEVPVIEALVKGQRSHLNKKTIQQSAFLGIAAGLLMMALFGILKSNLPENYLSLGETFKLNIVTRFLYGGFTEEIIMRFGLMTTIAWILSQIMGQLKSIGYWIAIVVAAFVFGLGHLPLVYMLVDSPTYTLITFILLGNMIGGVIFGWLYWKKGLEAAFIAHIFTHVALLLIEELI